MAVTAGTRQRLHHGDGGVEVVGKARGRFFDDKP